MNALILATALLICQPQAPPLPQAPRVKELPPQAPPLVVTESPASIALDRAASEGKHLVVYAGLPIRADITWSNAVVIRDDNYEYGKPGVYLFIVRGEAVKGVRFETHATSNEIQRWVNENYPMAAQAKGVSQPASPFFARRRQLGELPRPAATADDERIAAGLRPMKFLERMTRYRPANNTQSIFQLVHGNNVTTREIRATGREQVKGATPDRWTVPGGMIGVHGWRSDLYKELPTPPLTRQALLPVVNSFGNIQHELGWTRTYADGSVFADVLSNDNGKVFEVRVAEKRDGQWDRYVAYSDAMARPAGYVSLRTKDCRGCHEDAKEPPGSGPYGEGLIPGADTIVSDPFDDLERR